MKTKIFIIVEGGMVSSVYSSDPNIKLEIVDLDSQEEDESDEASARQLKIESDKSLIEIYWQWIKFR